VKLLTVAVVLAGLVSCSGTDTPLDRPPSTVAFDGVDALLHVEVADNAGEQQRGLSGIEQLPADQGMAFVWPEPVGSRFWMKDTPIPLSIAFVDEAGRVIDVLDMQPCESDPCPTYGVDEPYVLAIEANIGWFREHGVEAGNSADLRVMAYQ
jgi:uncharacterized membrane protein (UPF0127 family)